MEVFTTKLESVLLIKPPTVFEDFRGHYIETYNRNAYFTAGIPIDFIQDDISDVAPPRAARHPWRHQDLEADLLPAGQLLPGRGEQRPELVAVPRVGGIYPVRDSNHLQVLVPPNFGNGHLVMSERAIFHYKQSTEYNRAGQFTLPWNDPALNIWWPMPNPIVSERDQGNAVEGRGLDGRDASSRTGRVHRSPRPGGTACWRA